MKSISVEQGRRYICYANNSAGESQRLFKLTVGEYIANSKNACEFCKSLELHIRFVIKVTLPFNGTCYYGGKDS